MKIFRNRTVIGVLCILLALIICFGVTPLFSRSASEKTEIVRVTKDIKEGDEITAEMVQTVEVGAYNLPQNLMTDKKEVVGKYATADLVAGDYILSSKLSAVPAAENAYLYNLDGTKQAISVTAESPPKRRIRQTAMRCRKNTIPIKSCPTPPGRWPESLQTRASPEPRPRSVRTSCG